MGKDQTIGSDQKFLWVSRVRALAALAEVVLSGMIQDQTLKNCYFCLHLRPLKDFIPARGSLFISTHNRRAVPAQVSALCGNYLLCISPPFIYNLILMRVSQF